MGYRSQVAYTIRFVSPDETLNRQSFYTFLAEAKIDEDTSRCFSPDENCLAIDEVKLQINFYENWVKWYEDYPEVKCHENLMSKAREWIDDKNQAVAYHFVRIGEETNDLEENFGGDYGDCWIELTRSMTMDWHKGDE